MYTYEKFAHPWISREVVGFSHPWISRIKRPCNFFWTDLSWLQYFFGFVDSPRNIPSSNGSYLLTTLSISLIKLVVSELSTISPSL